ncbi:MAG: hypothetical protein ACKVOK_12795, partial [Flavobacteriales bacterium]
MSKGISENASQTFNVNLIEGIQAKGNAIWILVPLFGIIAFILLYGVATCYYPGGSYSDFNSEGFSWVHNYWCNLLNHEAMNGQYNAAQPIALTAMLVLCISLAFFWILFPAFFNLKQLPKRIIQFSGVISMTIAFFLFADFNHDLITDFASCFGIIASAGTIFILYKVKWYGLFRFGLLNIALVGLNNYLYFSENMIKYLPVVQKISFVSFLVWISF